MPGRVDLAISHSQHEVEVGFRVFATIMEKKIARSLYGCC
jgi:hypothetical protein